MRVLLCLESMEARLWPQSHWLTRGVVLRIVGVACFASGLLIVLPIPFGNTAPALSVLLRALGISAPNGLLSLSGLGAFALALAFDVGMVVLSWDLIRTAINTVFCIRNMP